MGCTAEELGERMSYRELRERMIAEQFSQTQELLAILIAEIRNTVSTEKLWTKDDLFTQPQADSDDEEDDYEPQTKEQIIAALAGAGIPIEYGNDH